MKAYFKVKWSHGFEYTTVLESATINRIESYSKHLDSIPQIESYTVTNEKKQVIDIDIKVSKDGKRKYSISLQK